MILLMAAARTWLGISPPPEALPDRFAPTIPIPTFFSLFDRFGGYNGLKRFGIISGLAGLFAVGAVVGVIYALIVESRRSRESGRWQEGLSRSAVAFIITAALVLWVISMALLWPVLDANYRGVPPGPARIASAAALLIEYLMFGSVVILLYRWLVPRPAVAALPMPMGDPVGRRAVVVGAAGVALAAGSGALLRNLEREGDLRLRRYGVQRSRRAADRAERPLLHGDQERGRSQRQRRHLAAGDRRPGRRATRLHL